jgi:hypothetical protein
MRGFAVFDQIVVSGGEKDFHGVGSALNLSIVQPKTNLSEISHGILVKSFLCGV